MADIRKRFDVPIPFYYQKIDPELRKKLFTTIAQDMPKHNTSLKFLGGFLNWDMNDLYDFFVIYETQNTMGKPFVMVKLAVLGDRFSIQGFYYTVLHDQTKEYFEDMFDAFIPLEKEVFNNIIEAMGYNMDKKSEKYWRKPDHMTELGRRLIEITKRYNPQITVMR